MPDTQHQPEAVSVLVATRDPLTVRLSAPIVAARLYPGRRFGPVLHQEPAPEPEAFAGVLDGDGNPYQWTEAAVEVLP